MLGSPGSLSLSGTRAAAPQPGQARPGRTRPGCSPTEGPACPSSVSSQPGGPPQSAHRSRQDLASPSTLHLRDLCYALGPEHPPWREGFSLRPSSPAACPFLPQDGAFGQAAWLVVGQEWARRAGWASSPLTLPAGEAEATEE